MISGAGPKALVGEPPDLHGWVMDDFLIAVGWDGSPEAEDVVRAAAGLARRANGRLRVILGWDWLTQPVPFDPHFNEVDAARHVQEAAKRLVPPDVPYETRAELGFPYEVLLSASRDAQMLVIGRSGLGRAFARLMGSTATEVVRKATIPVVVVPSQPRPVEPPPRRAEADSEAGADGETGAGHEPRAEVGRS